ncbi:MAG: thioredoxin domain-containing protein [Candidatus Eisenbacteria bacterium]
MSARPANRLAGEKSPYLLQHAHNPVDWHPWGEPAFELARRTDRPIFLSIGYATCHWCHVMERESFEDERVALLLNEHFVSIKVDREERPDVDRVYMTAMQAMGLGGGWPLNVFLTPDLAPFYGGTYFPTSGGHGRPGMLELLPHIAAAWNGDRAALEENGRHLLAALGDLARAEASAPAPGADALCDAAFAALERSADPEWGGFGRAPKFPTAANLAFLWADAARVEARDPARAEQARRLALFQLARMRERGIHDHLGGGFHRYSVDRTWLVPHFEKMLYDQAQLAIAYADAFHATGLSEFADAARGIFEYVARDLTGGHGAFLSAEDADSEGEEGRFYVWRPEELAAALGGEEAALFAARYGVTPEGNFEGGGATVLHEAEALEAVATRFGLSVADVSLQLADARARLLAARALRPRPLLDDKVITAWNGLMISACARGAVALGDDALAQAGGRAARFVLGTLWDGTAGRLARRWREGEAAGAGQLDDYAFLARGLLDLYRATFDPAWLEQAVLLADAMIARFADESEGAFFESPEGDPTIMVRMKDGFDGAELAGNSIAAQVCLELAGITDRPDLGACADATLAYYERRLAEHPVAMPQMLVALMAARVPPRHVVLIAGDAGAEGEDLRALVNAARGALGARDALLVAGDERARARLAKLAPVVAPLVARGGRATAYVCVEGACHAPTHDPAVLAADLRKP